MQTQIHFCDLCNESVPQSDLDQGRAFLRKGRVVCAKCDALMSHEKRDDAPAATLTAEPAPPVPPLPAVPSAAPHVSRSAHARDRTALGIALAAVVLVIVLGYWTNDQLARTREQGEARNAALANGVGDAKRAADRVAEDARRDIDAAEERARQALDAQRVRVEAAGVAQEKLAGEVAARVDGLAREIASMRETIGQVTRHDSELVALQQRYNLVEAELQGLRADLERRAAEAEAAPAAPVEPPAPARPAWIGLVDGLASANPSERWNAIHALGETRDPAAAEYVVPALKDVDIFIRMTAARVLGELASPGAIEPLIAALDDGEGAVRESAYDALKKLTGRNLPFDPQSADAGERAKQVRAWQEWWKKEREKLGS